MRKDKIFTVEGIEDCPGDALMKLYRTNTEELRKNVLFSQTSIDFFKSMADVVEKDKRILTFYWAPIIEEGLPSLKIKVQKKGRNYELIYLKEKVTYKERQNEFEDRITLNLNKSVLKKVSSNGTIILNKKEKEMER